MALTTPVSFLLISLCIILFIDHTEAFHPLLEVTTRRSSQRGKVSLFAVPLNRRSWVQQVAPVPLLLPLSHNGVAHAAVDVTTAEELKTFVDPVGYFRITIPKRFFAIRRTEKGDLPDSSRTGRRGFSIFTSGDMSKAQVVAIERFPIGSLLQENGITVSESADLSTFSKLGQAQAIATLLQLRRDQDKDGGSSSKTELIDPVYSVDDKTLTFALRTELTVQKPELLMETFGVDRLFRKTTAKASLESNDGYMMVAYASALEKDFEGPDGAVLQQAINSFQALDQSKQ